MTRKSNRRDFLRGKLAAESLADAAQRALPEDSAGSAPTDASAAGYLLRISRRAMACEFEVCLSAGQYERGTELALEALDLVEALEEQLSYFRPTSEISAINRAAARQPVTVKPRLFELLEMAMRVSEETARAFDLTSTPLWEAWGFSRRAGAVPSPQQVAEALTYVGGHLVELDPQRLTIRFRRQGVRLNLGSVGKGCALDRCAERLLAAGIGDFLLHGGYSSVLARGSPQRAEGPPRETGTPGWTVGIRHPLRPDRRVAEVRLSGRALSTSGAWAQSFRYRGRRYGHIIDPRTGQPAEGVLSATAIAPSAALAEALSTAFYVMGPDLAIDYCRPRPELAAVVICRPTQGGGIDIRSTGFSDRELVFSPP